MLTVLHNIPHANANEANKLSSKKQKADASSGDKAAFITGDLWPFES